MFITLLYTELRQRLLHPQFRLMWGIIVFIFLCGSLSFHYQWKHRIAEFTEWQQTHEKDSFTFRLSQKALTGDEYRFTPRFSEIISSCNQETFPQSISFSVSRIIGYNTDLISENPLLERQFTVNWSFIVSTLLSFVALLLSYDILSGHKHNHFLAFIFSYPVSRRLFLLSRYLSAWLLCGLILASGMLVSIIYLFIAEKAIPETFLTEAGGFYVYSMIFLSLFVSFGLFSSIITHRPGSSLLVSIAFWLLCVIILPNCNQFIAQHFYPFTETSDDVAVKMEREQYRLMVAAPPESLTNKGDSLAFPPHKARAELYTKINEAYKRLINEYSEGTFQQYENTLNTLKLTPFNLYEQMNEHWLDGGYTRFKKNWEGMKVFQKEYEEWFKAEDAKDSASPHWYNPLENLSTSRKLIKGSEFPDYTEPEVSLSQKSIETGKYVLILSAMSFLLLIISIFAFNKYDVR